MSTHVHHAGASCTEAGNGADRSPRVAYEARPRPDLPSELHRHPLRQDSCAKGDLEHAWQFVEDPSIAMSRIAELPEDADASAFTRAVRREACTARAAQ
jgi:hypothetical protein